MNELKFTVEEIAAPAVKPPRTLTPQAQRALDEAEQRRALAAKQVLDHVKEINGRSGPEPVRYGDWEVKGLACDF